METSAAASETSSCDATFDVRRLTLPLKSLHPSYLALEVPGSCSHKGHEGGVVGLVGKQEDLEGGEGERGNTVVGEGGREGGGEGERGRERGGGERAGITTDEVMMRGHLQASVCV